MAIAGAQNISEAETEKELYMKKKHIGVLDESLYIKKVCWNKLPSLARIYLSPLLGSNDSEKEFHQNGEVHSKGQGETFDKECGNTPHPCLKCLMILFHQITDFMITWILMWSKCPTFKKGVKISYIMIYFIPQLKFPRFC